MSLPISTETRNLTVDEAEKRLLHVARMHPLSASVLFQKVDSVGRGNAGGGNADDPARLWLRCRRLRTGLSRRRANGVSGIVAHYRCLRAE